MIRAASPAPRSTRRPLPPPRPDGRSPPDPTRQRSIVSTWRERPCRHDELPARRLRLRTGGVGGTNLANRGGGRGSPRPMVRSAHLRTGRSIARSDRRLLPIEDRDQIPPPLGAPRTERSVPRTADGSPIVRGRPGRRRHPGRVGCCGVHRRQVGPTHGGSGLVGPRPPPSDRQNDHRAGRSTRVAPRHLNRQRPRNRCRHVRTRSFGQHPGHR